MLNDLERHCLGLPRLGRPRLGLPTGSVPANDSVLDSPDFGWPGFLLSFALDAARQVRPLRFESLEGVVQFKADGSPVTSVEQDIERRLRLKVAAFAPDAQVVGEETGGRLPTVGEAVAVDPIDGTWALINRTENFSVTLALFRDGEPEFGVVLNPATGEAAYAARGGKTRVLQVPAFGEPAMGSDLPLQRVADDGLLVHLHPGPASRDLAAILMQAWRDREILLLRSVGGSPCLGLCDAAKGSFVYVNRWSDAPASPYDLAAGELILKGAGGVALDLDGNTVSLVRHAGPFVAAVDAAACARVVEILGAQPPVG